MKRLFTLLFLYPALLFAQNRTTPISPADLNKGTRLDDEDFVKGYETSVGWVIKTGDTLQLGRGTMPDKAFAFIYQNPLAFGAVYRNGQLVKQDLSSIYANKWVIVKSLGSTGNKRTGFTSVAIVGVGSTVRYQIEIENAIEAMEIMPPAQYRRPSGQVQARQGSVADELIKLKQLMDAGALTKDEFETQKKKLLNQ